MITVVLMSLPYLLLPAEAYIPALIALLVTVTLFFLTVDGLSFAYIVFCNG